MFTMENKLAIDGFNWYSHLCFPDKLMLWEKSYKPFQSHVQISKVVETTSWLSYGWDACDNYSGIPYLMGCALTKILVNMWNH